MRILFAHPDLGIGGAERLVVDAAVGLQRRGHTVRIFTSHHDRGHAFAETCDGTLRVTVRGDFLPRHLFHRLHALFAVLRSIYLAISIALLDASEYDLAIVDQVSAPVPILKLAGIRVLFYCHFPDKLLAPRPSFLNSLYRLPMDTIEDLTTGSADAFAVNSEFTAGIFRTEFPRISGKPEIVYPGISLEAYDKQVGSTDPRCVILETTRKTILSFNRFERKKNIALAIDAFILFRKQKGADAASYRLVLAGGYDPRLRENVEHHSELVALAQRAGLSTATIFPNSTEKPEDTDVLFLLSFSEAQRTLLLSTAICLVYTPSNEHFGIVPIEAMYMRVPVIACNSGGPKESIVDGQTGFLCEATADSFAEALVKIDRLSDNGREQMGLAGRQRVVDNFSVDAMSDKLDSILRELDADKKRGGANWIWWLVWPVLVLAVVWGLVRYY